ncbi:uncharacterized protein [Littorina saxatilis]|uniref:uncharacterized protein n=1 Tax=Littorina saxatilis TaxID=31220 RepID=UPI0038B4B1CB
MAPGKRCCMLHCTVSSHNSKGEKLEHGIRFFRIPKVKSHEGPKVEDVTKRRRRAWISAIRRTNITFERSSSAMRVCSQHFHSGKPSYEMMETDPDWAPSLLLGHSEMKTTDTGRHGRQKNRAATKQLLQEATEAVMIDNREAEGGDVHAEDDSHHEEMEDGENTRLREEVTQLEQERDMMRGEINRLLEENRELKKKLASREIVEESFQGDNEKVRFYTGLPSYATLLVLLNYLSPHLPQGRLLSPFQLLIVVFMRLRLKLPVLHIAYLFGIHRTTIASGFKDTLSVMYTQMTPFVPWPGRECLRACMPHQFVETFGNKVAVIIDCFEIFIERPSNLYAKAATFSNYKHNNTIKHLIGITPNGQISFISKGWGGRTTDRHITEECGFLDKLLPGDLVLADRGFDIKESVGLMCAEVKIPAFTRGKCQMEARSIEETRKLAHPCRASHWKPWGEIQYNNRYHSN